MSARDVEQLVGLVAEVEAASTPEQVLASTVVALERVRIVEDGLWRTRDAAICALYAAGESLQQIRDRTGLSRARLHQIIHAAR